MLMESLRDFVCGAKKGVPLALPFLLNNEQQFFESYGPVSGSLRKIGPSEEWFLLCGHKDADRPAAPPGESLTSPQGYQSTGFSACWRRYGLV